MPMYDFHMDFDRPSVTYRPGEAVTGKINFRLTKSKNFTEVRIKASGKARVHWTESSSDTKGKSTSTSYTSNENYFNIFNRLINIETGNRQFTLAPGQHSYSFTFQLPENIPCSFEHKYGHVRYIVKAVLDRPYRLDHKIVSPITVIAPNDASVPEDYDMGIQDEYKHNFSDCFFCSAGGMKINVSCQISRFTSGETIELIINYDNNSSSVDITKMKMELIKEMKFYARLKKKKDMQVLEKVKEKGAFGRKGETSLKIVVPPGPFSNSNHCSIMDINYQLALSISVSGMHSKIIRLYPVQLHAA